MGHPVARMRPVSIWLEATQVMAERFHAGAPGTADAGLRLQGYGLLHRNGGRLPLELLRQIRSDNGSTAAVDTQHEEVDTVHKTSGAGQLRGAKELH